MIVVESRRIRVRYCWCEFTFVSIVAAVSSVGHWRGGRDARRRLIGV